MDFAVLSKLGSAYLSLGKINEAIESLEQALQMMTSDRATHPLEVSTGTYYTAVLENYSHVLIGLCTIVPQFVPSPSLLLSLLDSAFIWEGSESDLDQVVVVYHSVGICRDKDLIHSSVVHTYAYG